MANIQIKLNKKTKKALKKAMTNPEFENGYKALAGQLGPSDKAVLRGLCDTDGFISDRDLIWAIIDAVNDNNDGLGLALLV